MSKSRTQNLLQIRNRLYELSLELGAIHVDLSFPFRWASGYMMPVYNDSRLLLALPEARRLIADGFQLLLEEVAEPTVEHIAGVATGGIAHAAILAERLSLPLEYIRSSTKSHGMSQKIEGLPAKDYAGAGVAVIEDVISTGESSLRASHSVIAAGGKLLGCLVIFSYSFPAAAEAFTQAGFKYRALLDFHGLLAHLERSSAISATDLTKLRHWHAEPFLRH